MATIELTVTDDSLLSKIVNACRILKGVEHVRVARKTKDTDITQTAGYREAMDDIKHGRVHHADSIEDMVQQILG